MPEPTPPRTMPITYTSTTAHRERNSAAFPTGRSVLAAVAFLVGFILIAPILLAQAPSTEPLSDRTANYIIRASLNDSLKTMTGTVDLTWTNPSADTIPDLQFHLYFNAFKSRLSTFSERGARPFPWSREDGTGSMRLMRISVRGIDHTADQRYIAPDDDNPDDETVLQVLLQSPVLPRERIQVEIAFEAKVPRNHARTGWWGDDFFFMVHWFPKIGVYEAPGVRFVPAEAPRGAWNCHQFHRTTEFYADFGTYDVELTLPARFEVGTTGTIQRILDNVDGTRTVFAQAADVHDFGWIADANVEVYHDVADLANGRKVRLHLFLQPGHGIAREAYLSSARATLAGFETWLGPGAYPYPDLTIVDPEPGSAAGGMEYPMLVTGGVSYPLQVWTRGGVRAAEGVTIHEIAHQYWYGMVANNEFEEAFLDEGFTTYSESRIAEYFLEPDQSMIDLWGLKGSMRATRRAFYLASSERNDARVADWTFRTNAGRVLAYSKWSMALQTLEGYLGRPKFDTLMRTYFWRWRFRHPSREDFVQVATEVAGEDLSWFFDQLLYGTGDVDYAVAAIRNPGSGGRTFSEVDIRRIGSVSLPVEIGIRFAAGDTVLEKWDGRARARTFRFDRTDRIEAVIIDPHAIMPLDVNVFNNSRVPENTEFLQNSLLRIVFWTQSLLATFF